MTILPAAPELVNDIAWVCSPMQCSEDCICFTNDQPCTATSACEGYSGVNVEDEDVQCVNPFTGSGMSNDSDDKTDE